MVEFASFLLFNDSTQSHYRVIMHIQSVKRDVLHVQNDEMALETEGK